MTIPRTITVMYSCDGCGLVKREVTVRARVRGEDLKEWMDYLTRRIGDDHHLYRPDCRSTTMKNLMIPMSKGDDSFVGESPK